MGDFHLLLGLVLLCHEGSLRGSKGVVELDQPLDLLEILGLDDVEVLDGGEELVEVVRGKQEVEHAVARGVDLVEGAQRL